MKPRNVFVWGFDVVQGDPTNQFQFQQITSANAAQKHADALLNAVATFTGWPLLVLQIEHESPTSTSLLVATSLTDEDGNFVSVDLREFPLQAIHASPAIGQIRASLVSSDHQDHKGTISAIGDFRVDAEIALGREITEVRLFLKESEAVRQEMPPFFVASWTREGSKVLIAPEAVPKSQEDRFKCLFAFLHKPSNPELPADMFVAILPFSPLETFGPRWPRGGWLR